MNWTLAARFARHRHRRRPDRHGRWRPDDTGARLLLRGAAAVGGLQRPGRRRRDAAGRLGRAHPERQRALGSRALAGVGSVPCRFGGVLLARALGSGDRVQNVIEYALGAALVIAAVGLFIRAYSGLAERARQRDGRLDPLPKGPPEIVVRPLPTVDHRRARRPRRRHDLGRLRLADHHRADGALPGPARQPAGRHRSGAGRAAGLLRRVRPRCCSAISSSAVTLPLLVGSMPGAYSAPSSPRGCRAALIRRALAFVLLASALEAARASTPSTTVVALVLLAALAGPVWMLLRRRHGFPAWPRTRAAAAEPAAEAAR